MTIDTTNPGLVNVANQADGLILVNQTIITSKPSYNAGPTINVADESLSKGFPINVSVS